MKPIFMKAHELHELIKKKQIKVEEIANAYIGRIEETDKTINAFITFNPEEIIEDAKKIDKYISEGGRVGPFTGIPVSVKDCICVKDVRNTCASKMLEDYIAVYDATVIKRLKEQNYLFLGKTNMDEFAMGSSNETSAFGPVKNPWDIKRVPGGSSGGPAASVAAFEAACAVGSDTGGSIRQPASLCGVVGFKPTYGRISRYGIVPFASSFDQIGPLARDVKDCINLYETLSGYDEFDSTSINIKEKESYKFNLADNLKGLKVGVLNELLVKGLDEEVRKSVFNTIRMLEKHGASIQEVSLPSLEYALNIYYIIAPSEASSNLSRFDGVRYGYRAKNASGLREMYRKTRGAGFGPEVKRRILLGTFCLSSGYYDAYYEKAQKVRTLIINDFKRAFSEFDILVGPTSPTTAFKLGERMDDLMAMYLSDICTIPANVAGLPAISIPCGLSKDNLPIGFQIMADTLKEDIIFKTAYILESEINWKIEPQI